VRVPERRREASAARQTAGGANRQTAIAIPRPALQCSSAQHVPLWLYCPHPRPSLRLPSPPPQNYARTYPNNAGVVEQCYSADGSVYTDCTSMVSIVLGSPGCDENISSGSPPADITAQLILEYGYGHLEVHNATHLFWSWEQTGTAATAPTDAASIETDVARGLRGAGGSAASSAGQHGHIHRHGDRAPGHGKGASASKHAPATRSRASLASAAAAGGAAAVPILDSLWVIKNSH